jgi:isocitrate/isopropylmalate dehydrogenase
MLNHIGVRSDDPEVKAAAERIKTAYNAAVREGERTGDLGGELGTEAFADAMIRRLT